MHRQGGFMMRPDFVMLRCDMVITDVLAALLMHL